MSKISAIVTPLCDYSMRLPTGEITSTNVLLNVFFTANLKASKLKKLAKLFDHMVPA